MQSKTSSLGENVSLSASRETDKCSFSVNVDGCNSENTSSCMEDEDIEVPEILEEIIEMLLTGLRDTVCLLGKILKLCISLGENLWIDTFLFLFLFLERLMIFNLLVLFFLK